MKTQALPITNNQIQQTKVRNQPTKQISSEIRDKVQKKELGLKKFQTQRKPIKKTLPEAQRTQTLFL